MPLNSLRHVSPRLMAITGTAAALMIVGLSARTPQTGRGQAPPPPTPTLGLENGLVEFDTPDFTLKLVKDSQTVAALQPKGAKGVDANTPFDFTPSDQITTARRPGSLDDRLGTTWSRLRAGDDAGCLLCGAPMIARWSAGTGVVGGRCRDCGTELS